MAVVSASRSIALQLRGLFAMSESSSFDPIDADREMSTSRTTPGAANAEVFDLQGLCDRCMGNLDLVQRVLDKFEQRLPGELAELERVLEQGDATKITLVAHRIKGNSSNISASGLQQAAAEIEDLSRAGRVSDIHGRLGNLRKHWQRYVDCRATLQLSAAVIAGHAPTSTLYMAATSGAAS